MSIKLTRTPDGYQVEVTTSPRLPTTWSSGRPLPQQEVIDRLIEFGYHMQDVADALHFADEDWTKSTGEGAGHD
jgi:hypothetical protein